MGTILALGALVIVLSAAAWNLMGAGRTLAPAVERVTTGVGVVLSVAALSLGGGGHVTAVGLLALGLSGLLLLLTYLSGLPHQDPGVAVGERALDFETSCADGSAFRLSALRDTPVLLKFFRGYWCPYCVSELRDFDSLAASFAALGVRVVAISPDRVDELQRLTRTRAWWITLLADPATEVARLYNVQNRNFTPRRGPFRELVIPTSILIDAGGIVRWIDQASDFRQRAPAWAVLAEVQAVLSGRAVTVEPTHAVSRGAVRAVPSSPTS